MNTPITTGFFKKLALYQEIVSLNKIFRSAINNHSKDSSKNTWEIEKKFLLWTRSGHKHLGSAIKAEHFKHSNRDNKLGDVYVSENEVKDKTGNGQYWLANLVRRGYAEFKDGDDGEGILTSRQGLLMGSVLFDIYKVKAISSQKLWHIWFWRSYKDKYGGEYFLAKRYKFWFYWLFVEVGWLVFITAIILVFWSMIEKIPL